MAFVAPLLPIIGSYLGSAAGLSTALGVASAGIAGLTAIQSGNYQSAVAKNNATIAEQNAASESEASQIEAARQDRETAALLGEQLAAQGASGLDILGRTQMMTRNVTRRIGGEKSLDIRRQGTNEARRLMQEAANFRAEGKQAKVQGYLNAAGSALQAGSSLIGGSRKRMPWGSSRGRG